MPELGGGGCYGLSLFCGVVPARRWLLAILAMLWVMTMRVISAVGLGGGGERGRRGERGVGEVDPEAVGYPGCGEVGVRGVEAVVRGAVVAAGVVPGCGQDGLVAGGGGHDIVTQQPLVLVFALEDPGGGIGGVYLRLVTGLGPPSKLF